MVVCGRVISWATITVKNIILSHTNWQPKAINSPARLYKMEDNVWFNFWLFWISLLRKFVPKKGYSPACFRVVQQLALKFCLVCFAIVWGLKRWQMISSMPTFLHFGHTLKDHLIQNCIPNFWFLDHPSLPCFVSTHPSKESHGGLLEIFPYIPLHIDLHQSKLKNEFVI